MTGVFAGGGALRCPHLLSPCFACWCALCATLLKSQCHSLARGTGWVVWIWGQSGFRRAPMTIVRHQARARRSVLGKRAALAARGPCLLLALQVSLAGALAGGGAMVSFLSPCWLGWVLNAGSHNIVMRMMCVGRKMGGHEHQRQELPYKNVRFHEPCFRPRGRLEGRRSSISEKRPSAGLESC